VAAFFLDHNVSTHLLYALQSAGHSAIAVRDRFDPRATDEFVLLHAAEHKWILITHNRKDFELLHRAWQRWRAVWTISQQHSGILILPLEWSITRTVVELNAAASNLLLMDMLYRYVPEETWEALDLVEYQLLNTTETTTPE
jgi:hypothetical protein